MPCKIFIVLDLKGGVEPRHSSACGQKLMLWGETFLLMKELYFILNLACHCMHRTPTAWKSKYELFRSIRESYSRSEKGELL